MANIYRTWIYHKTEEAKIINSDEFESYKEKGWADSPSCFVKTTDFGVDPKDKEKVQALGEAIEGVADRINGELNIDVLDKEQLEMFAREHFNIELDRRKRVGTLRKQVKKLIKG
jgi:hypothetical protein